MYCWWLWNNLYLLEILLWNTGCEGKEEGNRWERKTMPSFPQTNVIEAAVCVETNQFRFTDSGKSKIYLLLFFCLPGWHPNKIHLAYVLLHLLEIKDALFCGSQRNAGTVGVIIQSRASMKPLPSPSPWYSIVTLYTLYLSSLEKNGRGGGGDDTPIFFQ